MKVTRMKRTHLTKKEAKTLFSLNKHALPCEGSITVLREDWATGEREYLEHAGREGQVTYVHEWPEEIDGTAYEEGKKPECD